jgi:hypothetical protein
MAIAETAARKLLHGSSGGAAAVARGVAAGTLGFDLDGLWQLIGAFFANIFAGAAHRLLVLPLEALWQWLAGAFWRWLQSAAAVALPYVLAAAALLLLVGALSFILPSCVRCCAVVTMNAPGAAGRLISRTAFEANPQLFFLILRTAGPVVATGVFCSWPVAWAVAAPVAILFSVCARA